jgi:hypothetical protein
MSVYDARCEDMADLWWDRFDATQLLMWHGIYLRAAGRMERRRAMGLYDTDIDDLISDLWAEVFSIYCTLMLKCSLVSDATEVLLSVSDVMGSYHDFKDRLGLQ